MATLLEDITVTPTGGPLGAAVTGVDLSAPLTETAFRAILDAWHQYIVLVFPNQDITEADQAQFAAMFGEIGDRGSPQAQWGTENQEAHLLLISNIREGGKLIGSLPDGEMFFHSDMAYVEVPHKATMLYGMEIPKIGGDTRFANLYDAYDAVPDELKTALAGRTAMQIYSYALTERVDLDGDLTDIKRWSHPVFRTHPETGRKSLFVSRLMTACIDGLPRDESDDILDQLFEISERPEFILNHKWTVGDLVMWDNRCCNHGRTDFPETERRKLRRITIVGEEAA